MGQKISYSIGWNFSEITGEVMTASGEIKRMPIKLVSIKNGDQPYPSDNMEDVCEQVLRGEKTEWTLREVTIEETYVELIYERPSSTEQDNDFISFTYTNDIELVFEVERGEGMIPDRYVVSCFGRKDPDNLDSDYYPKLVEYLCGGALRRTLERPCKERGYTMTEERF